MKLLTHKTKKLLALFAAGFSPALAMAQTATPEVSKTWFVSDPVFWLLTIVALILLYVIYALSELLIFNVKRKLDKQNTSILMLFVLFACMLMSNNASAQAATTVATTKSNIFSDPYFPLYLLIAIEVLIIGYMSFLLYGMAKAEEPEVEYVPQESFLSKIWQKLNPTVPIEKEDDIKLNDHIYDGIQELDNGMPPWLQFIFFATILFAVIYAPYYLLGYAPTQEERYDNMMADAAAELEARRMSDMNFVDENTVELIQTADVLSAGKETFVTYCVACHGNGGEGGVGPNLTDDYWIHGGAITDLFKTIKYGVPEKGMAPWEAVITPKQISEVSNYIKSLYGTNPPNAKEPQGVIWTEGVTTPADSTLAPSDTTDAAAVAVQ